MWHKQILTPKRVRLKMKKENLTFTRVSLRNPKRELGGLIYWHFARNTLGKTKIQNLHP